MIYDSEFSDCLNDYAVNRPMYWVWPPHRMPVTTRIITYLVGDSYKPSFATVIGRGPHSTYVVYVGWWNMFLNRH